MDEEWKEFALKLWTNPDLADENDEAYHFTRSAESMSKALRDPSDRRSGELHRIHWLEESIGVMHTAMLKQGKQVFGDAFYMSWPYFLNLRPFYLKDVTRHTCMCVYHMRFDEMANGLHNYRKTLRQQQISPCFCSIPGTSRDLRNQLVCPRGAEKQTLDNTDCILQRCSDGKDLGRLFSRPTAMCALET